MNNLNPALPGAYAAEATATVPAPTERWRLVSLYRFVALAIAGALLLAGSGNPSATALQWWLIFIAAASLATIVHWFTRSSQRNTWILAEAVIVAGLAGAAPVSAESLSLYLLVPAFWAGIALSPTRALLTVGAELAVYITTSSLWFTSGGGAPPPAAWPLLILGAGVLGVWTARIQRSRNHEALAYDRALVLLRELSQITRLLPVGLDRTAVLDQCIAHVQRIRPGAEVAIYMPGHADWEVERGRRPSALAPATPGTAIWQQVLDRAKPALVRDPAQGGAHYALLPLVHRRSRLAVVRVALGRGDRLSAQDVRTIEAALSGIPVRLEASAVFSDVRQRAIVEERSRLSRQIHDGVAQDLAGLAYALDTLAISVPQSQERHAIQQSADEVRRLVEELRFSIFDLRTELQSGERLGTALTSYVRQVGDRSGLRVHVEIDDVSADVPSDVGHELMRIAQESVTNARRHSRATTLWVSLRIRPEGVMLRVSDDGTGFLEPSPSKPGNGVGLAIIRERIDRLGGTLAVRKRAAGGTVVECLLGPAATQTRVTASPWVEPSSTAPRSTAVDLLVDSAA